MNNQTNISERGLVQSAQPMPAKRNRSFVSLIVLATFLLFLTPHSVLAVTKTWVGPEGGNWSAAANWSPNGAPAAADLVIIPGASGTGTRPFVNTASSAGTISASATSGGAGTVSIINFNDSTSVLTVGTGVAGSTGITGGFLQFRGSTLLRLNNNQIWDAQGITFLNPTTASSLNTNARTITVGNGTTQTNVNVTGAITSGTGGFIINNLGSLLLGTSSGSGGQQANTFSGGIVVNSGGVLTWGGLAQALLPMALWEPEP